MQIHLFKLRSLLNMSTKKKKSLLNMRRPEHIVAPPEPPPPPPPPVLPHELVFEILSWLPVKSLVRFKLVCKSWNSLVSDPQFAKLHLHRSSAKNADFAHLQLLISCKIDDSDQRRVSSCSVSSIIQNPTPNLALPFGELEGEYRVFGSCNGLISLVTHIEGELWIRIWNPATRSISQKSPPLRLEEAFIRDCASFGFGYDYLTDTYKVVLIFLEGSVQVYSLIDNSWRSIQHCPSYPDVDQGPRDGVYLSGTLNWLARDKRNSHKLHIVSLDLGNETYVQLSLPYHSPDLDFEPVLGVLRGCLCVSRNYEETHFVVWQMSEFGVRESWTRLVNVSFEYLETSGYPKYHYGIIVLCMSENDDVLMMSAHDQSQVILYNRRDNRLQRIEIPDNISLSPDPWYGGNVKFYLESLISPC